MFFKFEKILELHPAHPHTDGGVGDSLMNQRADKNTSAETRTMSRKHGIAWFCVKVLRVFNIILPGPVFLCKEVNTLGRWNDSDSKNWCSNPITQVQCSDSTIDRTNTQTHATLRAQSFNFIETSSSIIPRSVLLYSLKKHNNNNKAKVGDVAHFVECLPNTQKV